MTKLRRPRAKRARWLAGGVALVVLGGGGLVVYEEFVDDDLICCALPPPLYGVPRGPDGEIAIASQSVETEVLVGHDFSIHVRPGGDAADWRLADAGEAGGVLRATGEKTVEGTHYFTFRPLRTGKTHVVLKETDGDRTMTYPIEVKEGDHLGGVTDDPTAHPGSPREPENSRTVDGDFEGTVTLRPTETVRLANRYDNQPGYTWEVVRKPDASVAWLRPDTQPVTGDPAATRADWYTFDARAEGTTTVELFGCYRCETGKPETTESKKFSVTKSVTLVVR